MSHHHHHPHEGHSDGSHNQRSAKKPLHHDWRFYAAGLCILVALVIYLLSGDLAFQPRLTPVPAPMVGTGGK
jgi:hypothetical protein